MLIAAAGLWFVFDEGFRSERAGLVNGGPDAFEQRVRAYLLDNPEVSRALGLTLDQVRAILGGVERDAYGCAEVRALLADCAKGVRRQIDELQEIEGNLRTLVEACGDAELSNCRLIEAMLAGDEGTVDPGCRCSG